MNQPSCVKLLLLPHPIQELRLIGKMRPKGRRQIGVFWFGFGFFFLSYFLRTSYMHSTVLNPITTIIIMAGSYLARGKWQTLFKELSVY